MPEQQGEEFELFNRKNLHELVHWTQYAGTTWGIFVSLSQLGESQRVARWLQQIGSANRSRFFSLHETKQTILSLDDATANLVVNVPDIASLQQETLGDYVALFYSSYLLRDTSRFAHFSYSIGKVLAQGLQIVANFPWTLDKPSYTPYGNDIAIEDIQQWSDVEQNVSVTDILESAALVSECMSVGHAYEGDYGSEEFYESASIAMRRLLGIDDTCYSVAFRVWVGQHPELQELGDANPEMRNLGKAMMSFALLADAALNPPLPPVYHFEVPEQALWKDVDPAVRFNQLVTAGARLPLPATDINAQQAVDWIVALLDAAQLPGLHRDLDMFRNTAVEMTFDYPDDFSYVESILLPRFYALLRLRAWDCLSVAALGEFVQRETSSVGDEVLHAYQNAFWIPAFLNRQQEFISFLPEGAAARFIESVHLRRSIRLCPMLTMDQIVAKPHHQAFAAMRPAPEPFTEPTLRNLTTQYSAWFDDD